MFKSTDSDHVQLCQLCEKHWGLVTPKLLLAAFKALTLFEWSRLCKPWQRPAHVLLFWSLPALLESYLRD